MSMWSQNLRGRLKTARAVLSLRVVWLAMATGVSGIAVGGLLGAGSTVAGPTSITFRYTCLLPVINNYPVTVKVDADIPKQAVVDKATPQFVASATVTVDAAAVRGLRLIGMRTIEGTADASVRVAAPEGDIDVTVPFNVPILHFPESGSLYAKVTGTAPTPTFSRPGRAKIIVGDVVMHLTPKDASGNVTFPGKFDAPVPAGPRSGQHLGILRHHGSSGHLRQYQLVSFAETLRQRREREYEHRRLDRRTQHRYGRYGRESE